MIFDELVVTTNALDDLRRKTDLKNNKAMQDNTDARYRILLNQTNTFVSTVDYLYSNVSCSKNIEILSATFELLNSLKKVIESGLANQDEVSKAENAYKAIQIAMKKEWMKQYVGITGATISTLDAIKGIDSDNVAACLSKIQSAENWENSVNRLQNMMKGMEEADQLIQKLGLDDEIISFLQNTNTGKATLKDLSDKVFGWIRDENLEGKIRISFVRK